MIITKRASRITWGFLLGIILLEGWAILASFRAHGNFAAAWRFNPLLMALLPVGVWLGLRETARWTLGWRWPGIVTRPLFGWLLVIVAVVFGVARNLH